ncbi:MAG: hypothetical protein KME07_05190, partial [Pegethrix bostrychoides GSE-TBD4-15B]|nr:hypothetical protein [Pegethrix bostrychoides GSE-TBD4-15B]
GTINSARNLGTLKSNSSFKRSGTVGGSDLDFFKFKLDRNTDLSAELNNRGDDPIALTILDKSGNSVTNRNKILFQNVNPSDSQTLTTNRLPKGTYYIRLQNANGSRDSYDLRLKGFTSSSGSGGSGSNDIRNLGSLSSSKTYRYSGTVGSSDTDLYRFNISNRSRFSSSLFNNGSNPIALSLLDRNNRVVQTDNGRFLFANVGAGDEAELFAPTLASGSYSLRVQSAVGDRENYQVALRRSSASLFF